MPLSKKSPITAPEQAGLNSLFATFTAADTQWKAAVTMLNDFIAGQSAGSPDGQVADVFGDGEWRDVGAITLPPGMVPTSMRGKRTASLKPYIQDKESDRRSAKSKVSIGNMRQAEMLRKGTHTKALARRDASATLTSRISKLGFKQKQPVDFILDVFNDGLSRRVDRIAWPPGLEVIKLRRA